MESTVLLVFTQVYYENNGRIKLHDEEARAPYTIPMIYQQSNSVLMSHQIFRIDIHFVQSLKIPRLDENTKQ